MQTQGGVNFSGGFSLIPPPAGPLGPGLFVAVGGNSIMTSTNGQTWTSRVSPANKTWGGIAFGAGRFVAIETGGGNTFMHSTNGTSWTSLADPVTSGGSWQGIIYAGGRFVATGASGYTAVSTDGLTWTRGTAPNTNSWSSLSYDGTGTYLAVGGAGTNRAMTSTDGLNWTLRTTPNVSFGRSAYGSGRFVVIRTSSTETYYSTDGTSWTLGGALTTTVNGPIPSGFIYASDRFIMCSGDRGSFSTNGGNSWTAPTVIDPGGEINGVRSLAYGNNIIVGVSAGNGSKDVIISNNLAVNWTTYTGLSPVSNYTWNAVAYG